MHLCASLQTAARLTTYKKMHLLKRDIRSFKSRPTNKPFAPSPLQNQQPEALPKGQLKPCPLLSHMPSSQKLHSFSEDSFLPDTARWDSVIVLWEAGWDRTRVDCNQETAGKELHFWGASGFAQPYPGPFVPIWTPGFRAVLPPSPGRSTPASHRGMTWEQNTAGTPGIPTC